jgi:hypothetical protein
LAVIFSLKFTILVHLREPAVRIELEDAACCCLDWANSEVIAIGCSNGEIYARHVSGDINLVGVIAVYNVRDALLQGHLVNGSVLP